MACLRTEDEPECSAKRAEYIIEDLFALLVKTRSAVLSR